MRTKYPTVLIILLISITIISCRKDDQAYKFPLAEPNEIDAAALENAYEKADDINGLGAMIVERNGVLIAEEYFENFERDDLFNVKSVTKSVTSLLLGIALDKGFIDSLDQKATDYIGHLITTNDPVKRRITIRQILTMTGGFEWDEWENVTTYNQWFNSNDQINFLYSKDMQYTPGLTFVYNTALTHLLSVIIEKATGMTALEFAKEYLFEPIGIINVNWYEFPAGYNNGGADLMLRPIDMIKIGRMCLEGGRHNGVQIVPEDWITEATKRQVSTNNLLRHGTEYGYLWWKGSENEYDFFWALGYGGQFIVCVPEYDLVIGATSDFYRPLIVPSELWSAVENLIMYDVLPCIN